MRQNNERSLSLLAQTIMSTNPINNLTPQSLLGAGNDFAEAFPDAGGDNNAVAAPLEGAEAGAVDEEMMADAESNALH